MALTKKSFYKKPSIIVKTSWDDGHQDDWKVFELLKKYKIPGTFFIVLERVDAKDHLTWDQIKEIDRTEHYDIGCHTFSHPTDLKLCYDEMLHNEIRNAKGLLESALGHQLTKFCYPRGRYDKRVKQFVADAGFMEARTTKVGSIVENTNSFEKETTVHVYSGRKEYGEKTWSAYANEQLNRAIKLANMHTIEIPVFHLWGHGWEVDKNNEWDNLEEFFKHLVNKVEILYD